MPRHVFFGEDPAEATAPPAPPADAPSTSAGTTKSKKRPREAHFHENSDGEDEGPLNVGPSFSKNGQVLTNGASPNGKGKKKKAERKQEALRLESERQRLTIWTAKDKIVKAIEDNDTVVILGETGSGKTTQVPQFLLASSPNLRICCTQPRRVAATSLAERVSREFGCEVGSTVGYTVRFDDKTSRETRLRYSTDGSLLAEMLSDRDLDSYQVIILDEAHERTLRTDMLLGFLREIQQRRKERVAQWTDGLEGVKKPTELKIVVMSATIDAQRFSDFFGGPSKAPILYVKGRQYSVQLRYAESPVEDYHQAVLQTVFEIHSTHPPGDILVFLSGQDDIEAITASISAYLPSLAASHKQNPHSLLLCPLYAKLSPKEQVKAFAPAPPNTRKVVLATNVAETSITIPGIKFVIDTGLAKEKEWHAAIGIDSLMVTPISKSSAQQRMGRAGRDGPGWCFRLYPEEHYLQMEPSTKPEILRVSLVFALLQLLAHGDVSPFAFPYMDTPDLESLKGSLLTLVGLGAVAKTGKITEIGRKMARLPLPPELSTVLLASFNATCPEQILALVSLLSCKDAIYTSTRNAEVLRARERFHHRSGDHWTLLNVLRAFEDVPQLERKEWCRAHYVNLRGMLQVLSTRKQLRERCTQMGLDFDVQRDVRDDEEVELVLSTLVGGLFANTAIRHPDGLYRHSLSKCLINIHPGSSMHNKKVPAIVYDELVLTTKTFARNVSSVDLAWIPRAAPALFAAHVQSTLPEPS